jgi:UDP-2,3-diacylglucosamine pyrophosphatase LpxH
MKNRTTVICNAVSTVLTVASALSGGGFALYLYSLEGTPGLLEWMPLYRKVIFAIPLIAFVPLLLFAFATLLSKKGMKIRSMLALVPAIILSLTITAASLGGGLYHKTLAHTVPEGISGVGEYPGTSLKQLVRLAFSSDAHVGNPEADEAARTATLDTVATGGYDAFFILGDLAEMGVPGTNLEEAAALLRSHFAGTQLITLMGNHDSIIGGEYRYRKIFNKDLYYRIDSGNAHIIALNLLWGAESFDAAQKKWLTETLASIPTSDKTIVIAHSFIRSSGYVDGTTGMSWYDNEDLISEVAPLLESGGVDLVVSGHNHFMEYLEHGDTAYAIIGALGGKSDPERKYVSDDSRWYLADGKGFLDVDLYGDGIKITFRDQNGKQLFEAIR